MTQKDEIRALETAYAEQRAALRRSRGAEDHNLSVAHKAAVRAVRDRYNYAATAPHPIRQTIKVEDPATSQSPEDRDAKIAAATKKALERQARRDRSTARKEAEAAADRTPPIDTTPPIIGEDGREHRSTGAHGVINLATGEFQ